MLATPHFFAYASSSMQEKERAEKKNLNNSFHQHIHLAEQLFSLTNRLSLHFHIFFARHLHFLENYSKRKNKFSLCESDQGEFRKI